MLLYASHGYYVADGAHAFLFRNNNAASYTISLICRFICYATFVDLSLLADAGISLCHVFYAIYAIICCFCHISFSYCRHGFLIGCFIHSFPLVYDRL